MPICTFGCLFVVLKLLKSENILTLKIWEGIFRTIKQQSRTLTPRTTRTMSQTPLVCTDGADDVKKKWNRVRTIVSTCAGGGVGLYFFIKWLVEKA